MHDGSAWRKVFSGVVGVWVLDGNVFDATDLSNGHDRHLALVGGNIWARISGTWSLVYTLGGTSRFLTVPGGAGPTAYTAGSSTKRSFYDDFGVRTIDLIPAITMGAASPGDPQSGPNWTGILVGGRAYVSNGSAWIDRGGSSLLALAITGLSATGAIYGVSSSTLQVNTSGTTWSTVTGPGGAGLGTIRGMVAIDSTPVPALATSTGLWCYTIATATWTQVITSGQDLVAVVNNSVWCYDGAITSRVNLSALTAEQTGGALPYSPNALLWDISTEKALAATAQGVYRLDGWP